MRFVFAIVASVLAAVLITLGIGQRTIWAPPDSVSVATTLSGDAAYAVIDGATLTANPGRQTITIDGSGPIFAAYGRSADVAAWVGSSGYDAIEASEGGTALTSEFRTDEAPVPLSDAAEQLDLAVTSPAGSDLWLEEFTGTDSLTGSVNLPADMSIIIASDGTAPAPAEVAIDWPLDDSTPLAGPLIAGGLLMLLIGLIFYIWAFIHLRRQRGPRRRGPQGKRPPRARASRYRPNGQAALGIAPKKRGRGFVVVPVLLVSALGLSGCTADYWPDLAPTASTGTPTPSSTPGQAEPDEVVPPVVTDAQAKEIVAKVSAVATEADASLNATALAARFTADALESRTANYTIRATLPDTTAVQAIPASTLSLVLPQATTTWPRYLTTVITTEGDESVPPIALIMSQQSPRSNYLVEYQMSLEANTKFPALAPARVGTTIIAPDSKLTLLAPNQVATAYGDILTNGDASQYAALFDAESDKLRASVGPEYKANRSANLPSTARIEFSSAKGTGTDVALATNDSGALVAVSLDETETVRPVEAGATITTEGATRALSGIETSTVGVQTTYGYQLLFYVPPIASEEKIVLLGYTQGLVAAVQLP